MHPRERSRTAPASGWARCTDDSRSARIVATKGGFASALHSGDPAFEALPAYFTAHLGGALDGLLRAAEAAGTIRADVDATQLLYAAANLCQSAGSEEQSLTLVGLLVDGLRYRATAAARP